MNNKYETIELNVEFSPGYVALRAKVSTSFLSLVEVKKPDGTIVFTRLDLGKMWFIDEIDKKLYDTLTHDQCCSVVKQIVKFQNKLWAKAILNSGENEKS